MQRSLLEHYILEQIHLIERESYYNDDLLEESKIIDAFKSLIPRSKIEAAAGLGILGLIFSVAANTENLSNDSNTAFDQVEDRIEDAGGNTSNRSYKTAENEINRIMQKNDQTFAELVDKYRINDPSLMAELEAANNDVAPQQQVKDDLDEFFFSYMSLSGDGVYPSTFDDMSEEDYETFIDQFDDFLGEHALELSEKEYNQAMSLLFMTSASKHVKYESEEEPFTNNTLIQQNREDLQALHSFKSSLENVSDTLSNVPNTPEKQAKARQISREIAQGQLDKLIMLKKKAEEEGGNVNRYSGLIDQCKSRFKDYFGYSIDKDLDGNL